MLRFIPKIRQSKHNMGSASFWTFAIGEFILVFLGILIALQVDNWNQERKEQKLERVILSEMLAELKGDLEDIEYNARFQERLLNSNYFALNFLQSDLPWHDSLGLHFSQLMGAGIFDYNASAFESLKTIGIDLISNDSLRQQITSLYTVVYTHTKSNEDMLFDFLFENLYPSLRLHLKTVIPREMAIPLDLMELRQDNSFLEDIRMNMHVYSLSLRSYWRASQAIRDLIEAIELELEIEPES